MQSYQGLNKKAFTIIEALISFSISIFILSCIISFAFKMSKTEKINSILTSNYTESLQALTLIAKEIRQANSISSSSTQNKLILLVGTETICYEFLSGKIKRTKNSFGQFITNDSAIKSLKFSYPKNELVKIEIMPQNSTAVITNEISTKNFL